MILLIHQHPLPVMRNRASSNSYNDPASSVQNMKPSDIPDISEPSENQKAAAPEEDDIPF